MQNALDNFPDTDEGRRLAIFSIEDLDSDADGYSRLTEITDLGDYTNTPTFPGLTPATPPTVSAVAASSADTTP